jgi:DHA2 family multidrug resistance protein
LATLIDHRGALHYAHLAESVSPFSEATRQRLAQLAAGLQARGLDATEAMAGAHKVIEQIITQQSAVLAFRDCYLMIFAVFLVLAPLVPLLRRPGAAGSPSAASGARSEPRASDAQQEASAR